MDESHGWLSLCALQAPGDGEALCARLVSEGTAHAVASEDMDTLAFGGGVLIRQLNAKKDRLELCSLRAGSGPTFTQRDDHADAPTQS